MGRHSRSFKVGFATVFLSDLDPSLPSVFMTHSGRDGGCWMLSGSSSLISRTERLAVTRIGLPDGRVGDLYGLGNSLREFLRIPGISGGYPSPLLTLFTPSPSSPLPFIPIPPPSPFPIPPNTSFQTHHHPLPPLPFTLPSSPFH